MKHGRLGSVGGTAGNVQALCAFKGRHMGGGVCEVEGDGPVHWASSSDGLDGIQIRKEGGREFRYFFAGFEGNCDGNRSGTEGIDVARNDATIFDREHPEVTECLEVGAVVEWRVGPEGVERGEKGGDGEVGGAEGKGTIAEEENPDSEVRGEVGAIGEVRVEACVELTETAEDGDIAGARHDGCRGEREGRDAVADSVASEDLVVVHS